MTHRRLVIVLLLSGLLVSAGPVALCFTKPGRPDLCQSGRVDDLSAPDSVGRVVLLLGDLKMSATGLLLRSFLALRSAGLTVGSPPDWMVNYVLGQ